METNSVRVADIRNTACTVCGAVFSHPRAGKLYCSSRCKQFAYYHQSEIRAIQTANKGVENSVQILSLKDFAAYNSLVNKVNEYQSLARRKNSSYRSFESEQYNRYCELDVELPKYLKIMGMKKLSLEEWSFLKCLNPQLRKDDFFKLISSLDNSFFCNLTYFDVSSKKKVESPINILFKNHLQKIGEGKIKFT